jgi:asparagine synthase (glutamine-hydrolysing)
VKGLIPSTTATRRKQPFATPIGPWLRADLGGFARSLLSPESVRVRGLFEPSVVSGMVEDHMAVKRDHGTALWALMVLEHWQRRLDEHQKGRGE